MMKSFDEVKAAFDKYVIANYGRPTSGTQRAIATST